MKDTKERILTTALRLFAKNGYKGVSVSDVASELGITKGALYRHYESKRDIFDSIVSRMYDIDAERSHKYRMPAEKFDDAPETYREPTLGDVKEFTLAQFAFWTEDEFGADFRRMLTLEQFRDATISALYRQCIVYGPVEYMEDVFREMMKKDVLKQADPASLALEYYAPFFLLINAYDSADNKSVCAELLNEHIGRFIAANAVIQPSEKDYSGKEN